MLRTSLLFAAFAFLSPAAGLAEPLILSADVGVVRAPDLHGRVETETGGAYAGFSAASVPRPEVAAELGLSVGIRPRVWNAEVDFGHAPREVSVSLDRRVGKRGEAGGRAYFAPAAGAAGAEARAAVTVVRGKRIDGGIVAADALADPPVAVDAGLERMLAERCRLDPRYRDAAIEDPRAEMNLNPGF